MKESRWRQEDTATLLIHRMTYKKSNSETRRKNWFKGLEGWGGREMFIKGFEVKRFYELMMYISSVQLLTGQ